VKYTESIDNCLRFKNVRNFQGRASRSEFWWFYLFIILIDILAEVIFYIVVESLFISIIIVILLLYAAFAQLSVAVRRLHDVGKSGWWILLGLTIIGIIPLIIWYATESDKGENEYGPPPESAPIPT